MPAALCRQKGAPTEWAMSCGVARGIELADNDGGDMKNSFHTSGTGPARLARPASARGTRGRNPGLLHGSPGIDAQLLQLHAANDIPQFWTALQALLGATIPHDALIVYLNVLDFETSWQATEILATPNAQRPTKWFQNRRQVDMTPRFVLSQPKKIKI